MSERLQVVLSLVSLGLVVTTGVFLFRMTRPGEPRGELATLEPVSKPETVDAWVAWLDEDVQVVCKRPLVSTERDRFNNRTLCRRLGLDEDRYRFLQLVVVNYGPTALESTDAHWQAVGIGADGSTHESVAPAALLEAGRGLATRADLVVAEALGLREGPYRLPARTSARYLLAFDEAARPDRWRSLRVTVAGETLDLARNSFERRDLDRFLQSPERDRLGPRESEVARRPNASAEPATAVDR